MRTNFNNSVPVRSLLGTFDDGAPMRHVVDNYPAANPAYKKSNGFRASDISVLERFSIAHHDQSELDIVAARLKEIKKQPANKMSDEMLLKTLKPSWVQTASELSWFNERMYEVLSEEKAKSSQDIVKDTSTSVSSEVVDNVSSSSTD